MTAQAIDLPGIRNARELGGYQIGDRSIKMGVLLRTAGLDGATPEALYALQYKYRVQTVIDLRMSEERASSPDLTIPGVENLHLPVLEQQDMLIGADPALIGKYTDPNMDRMELFNVAYESGMLNDQLYMRFMTCERGKRAFRGFFKALMALDEGRAILWHCTDGKDRTGCAAMLVLFALGADRETVLRDYLLTNDYNAATLSAIRQRIAPTDWSEDKVNALLFMVGGVFEEYLQNCIDALVREYGSIEGYLTQELNIQREDIEALRQKFLT